MHEIFISYRHIDTIAITGRIYDWVARAFGNDAIFRDVNATYLGESNELIKTIHSALDMCKVMLIIIGKNWLSAKNENGQERLSDPEDLVRQEINYALKRSIIIIPIIVDGANRPSKSKFREFGLEELDNKLSKEIRHDHFEQDMEDVIRQIKAAGIHPIHRVETLRIDSNIGIIGAYRNFTTDSAMIIQYIENAKREINILITWISNWELIEESLSKAASRGVSIRFLLIDPTTSFAQERSKELEGRTGSNEYGTDKVRYNTTCIKQLYKNASQKLGYPARISLRYHASRPSVAIYSIDDYHFLGFFLQAERMVRAPILAVQNNETALGSLLTKEFDLVWNKETTIDIHLDT
ncbi:MAG: TIR domain-containing protein [Anaerolineae bacterium]|nr:TIR domain-containing protein [Anaerolineae bacterium]